MDYGFEPETSPVDDLLDTIGLGPGKRNGNYMEDFHPSSTRPVHDYEVGLEGFSQDRPLKEGEQGNFAVPTSTHETFMPPPLGNTAYDVPVFGDQLPSTSNNYAKATAIAAVQPNSTQTAAPKTTKPAARKPATTAARAKPAPKATTSNAMEALKTTTTADSSKSTIKKETVTGANATSTATASTTTTSTVTTSAEEEANKTGAKKRSRRQKLTPEERERRKQQRLELRRVKKSAREKQRRNRENQLFEELADLCELPKDNRDKSSILSAVIGTIVEEEDGGGTDSEFEDDMQDMNNTEKGLVHPVSIDQQLPRDYSVPKGLEMNSPLSSILPPSIPPMPMHLPVPHPHEDHRSPMTHHQTMFHPPQVSQGSPDGAPGNMPPPMQDPFALMPPPHHDQLLHSDANKYGLQFDFPADHLM